MPAPSGVLNPPQAKTAKARVFIPPTGQTPVPNIVTLTNSGVSVDVTTEGTKQNAIMTLASDPGTLNIQVGQYLQFVDSAGLKYIARVRTVFVSGTSLEVEIAESIPADATAQFPPEFDIRQSFSFDETVATNSFSSLQHTTATVSIGEGSGSVTADGGYSDYDAGSLTARYAKDNTLKVVLVQELESPDGTVYGTGAIQYASGVCTGISVPVSDGDSVLRNFTFDIQEVFRIDPTT
ncbi:MAG: hypothetical protein AAGJ95_16250 [Cyanobacteria bacterium J06554_11]